MPIKNILKDRQNVFVSDEFYDKISNGCEIDVDHIDAENVVVFCRDELFGIGNIKTNKLKLHTNLWEKND